VREELGGQRLDAIVQICEALLDAAHSLFILRETPIDALEAFEHLAANLLQSDHAGSARC
jgi:hypothetical protein